MTETSHFSLNNSGCFIASIPYPESIDPHVYAYIELGYSLDHSEE